MQLALYRSERPEVFDEIIGQKQIVRILQNQIRTGTVSQAYLFAGTHGTGKTTTARILAKAVNCLNGEPGTDTAEGLPCGSCANCEAIREGKFIDVIELDAASNNGVDDLRAIIELVKYPPTVGRYKVYIIDEVHMLSPAAENAFLKTLEEPPEYCIFILATTDPQKVRATIRSRCMQLNFKRVSEEELIEGMARICSKKGIEATNDALGTIAARADGSVRDALSILEQCMAAGDSKLDKNLVLEYTGAAGEDFYLSLTDAVESGDLGKALVYIDEIVRRGKDAKQLLKDWLEHYRNLMIVKYVKKAERLVGASAENIERLKAQADGIDIKKIERAIRLISEYINVGRYSDRPRIILETVAVRLAGSDAEISAGEMGTVARPVTAAERRSEARRSAARPGIQKQPPQAVTDPANATETVSDTQQNVADEEPIVQIMAAPRESAGDAADMWSRIVAEIAINDQSFDSMVGRNSIGYSYDNEELIVTVKKNKMNFANDKYDEIVRIARALYGPHVSVELREGDPRATGARNAGGQTAVKEKADNIDKASDIQANVSELFGMDVAIIDK